MAQPIRIAIFGNGFAQKVILPCLRHVEGIELVGISSPNLERLRETASLYEIGTVSTDHRELLEMVRPDLVFVTTPPHRHAEMAIDALEAGCHVVCEKPAALNAEESARMLAAAEQRPERLTVLDHELRFHPGWIDLRKLVASGRLGTITHVDYAYHATGRREKSTAWSWWCDATQGGGILGAIGSHAIDSLCLLLGDVLEVRARLQTITKKRTDPLKKRSRPVTSDELALARLCFASGATAGLHLSTVEAERLHRITLAGSEGTVQLDEQGPLRMSAGRRRGAEKRIEWNLPPAQELAIPDTDWAFSFLLFARRIVEALRNSRSSVAGAATFRDGHRTQLVLDAIRLSSEQGGWVKVATPGSAKSSTRKKKEGEA